VVGNEDFMSDDWRLDPESLAQPEHDAEVEATVKQVRASLLVPDFAGMEGWIDCAIRRAVQAARQPPLKRIEELEDALNYFVEAALEYTDGCMAHSSEREGDRTNGKDAFARAEAALSGRSSSVDQRIAEQAERIEELERQWNEAAAHVGARELETMRAHRVAVAAAKAEGEVIGRRRGLNDAQAQVRQAFDNGKAQGAREEREACVRDIRSIGIGLGFDYTIERILDAIRARGDK
jgi:hypothetical protein